MGKTTEKTENKGELSKLCSRRSGFVKHEHNLCQSSLEMSPFSVLVLRSFVEFGNLLWPSSFVSWPLFSFLVPIPVFLEKIPRQDALGTTIPISLDLQHPLFCLLAWPGAQPCGARRAKPLGRRGGPGQSRPRHSRSSGRNSPLSFLHSSTSSLSPGVVRRRYPGPLPGLGHSLPPARGLRHARPGRCRDLLPLQRVPAVLDSNAAVPPFAYQHFPLRWRVVTTLRLELKKSVVVAHHPVLANRALAFQPENPVQCCCTRHTTVIVLRFRRCPCKPAVMFWQIFPVQIHVGWFVTAHLLPSQLFHQPVLMGTMNALHAPLGLRRIGRDDRDPELRAHEPKLRDRLGSAQPFPRRGRPLVQVLPVHVQRQRDSVALNPSPQRIGYRPDRLFLAQLFPVRVGGVIHPVDQTTFGAAFLQPRMKAPVQLHQLPKVLFALAPPTMPPALPLPTPQPLRQHPASQRFGVDAQPILGHQLLRRQCRSETLAHRPTVLLPHQPQYLAAKCLLVCSIRSASRIAVLQARWPFFSIALPQSLRVSIAHAHQHACIHQTQLLAAHSRKHFHSPQLPLAHLRPPQSDLLSEVLLRGHFYRGQEGTLSSRFNSMNTT